MLPKCFDVNQTGQEGGKEAIANTTSGLGSRHHHPAVVLACHGANLLICG